MRHLILILLSSFCLFVNAQKITCPKINEITVTEGWALTSEHQEIDWDGSLGQDQRAVGNLLKMGLVRSEGINGYFVQCIYKNATLSNVQPITGICDPQGLLQNCVMGDCVVDCNDGKAQLKQDFNKA